MKTVVLGLFDDLDTARRVLNQLAASPLDLDQISVVHGDLDTQRSLARGAGLPAHRGPLAGVVAGALVGAAAGYFAGVGLAPQAVGWLLALALGAVVGAAIGGALGAMSETVRVPKVHQVEVLQALGEGATALIVRSDSLPTARAVGDLFRVAGSRELSLLGPPPPQADADDPAAAVAAVEPAEGVIAEPLGESFAGPTNAADFARFAPPSEPDQLPSGGATVASGSARTPLAESTGTDAHDTSTETIFAPPWRRGVVDPADVSPTPAPSMPAAPPVPAASPPASFAPADVPSTRFAEAAPAADVARAAEVARTADIAAVSAAATSEMVSAAPDTAPPSDASSPTQAPLIAGRTATQRIARLLLDAIDDAERAPEPKRPARRRST